MKILLFYLLSRGLYSFAFASVPVLLSISASQDGYNSSEIGLILGLGALPAVFGGVLAPMILYRISQKNLFSAITVGWILLALLCATYSYGRKIPLQGYVGISFFIELGGAIMIPTMGSFLPQIVEEHRLAKVNSLQTFILGLCAALGPATVSISMLFLGAPLMWFVLAVFMLVSLLLQKRLPDITPTRRDNIFSGVLADFRYLVKERPLLHVIIGSAVWHFVIWPLFMTQGPVVMRDAYGSPWAWGFIQSVFSVGSIFGSLITIPDRFKTVKVCLLSLLPFCFVPAEMLFGLPLIAVYVTVAVGGLAIAAASVRWSTALQKDVPDDHLAGVFGFDYVFSEGISPIGFIVMPMLCSNMHSVLNYFVIGLVVIFLITLSASNNTLLHYENDGNQ